MTAYPAAVDTERTLEEMQADLMRTHGYGLIEHPYQRYVPAEDVVDHGLGPESMQKAAADWFAAHPTPKTSLSRRIRRRLMSILTR